MCIISCIKQIKNDLLYIAATLNRWAVAHCGPQSIIHWAPEAGVLLIHINSKKCIISMTC